MHSRNVLARKADSEDTLLKYEVDFTGGENNDYKRMGWLRFRFGNWQPGTLQSPTRRERKVLWRRIRGFQTMASTNEEEETIRNLHGNYVLRSK